MWAQLACALISEGVDAGERSRQGPEASCTLGIGGVGAHPVAALAGREGRDVGIEAIDSAHLCELGRSGGPELGCGTLCWRLEAGIGEIAIPIDPAEGNHLVV